MRRLFDEMRGNKEGATTFCADLFNSLGAFLGRFGLLFFPMDLWLTGSLVLDFAHAFAERDLFFIAL